MRKIRIGNDIRLAVDLRLYIGGRKLREREVYNPENSDFYNIDKNEFINKDYEVYYPNQYTDAEQNGSIKPKGGAIGIRSVKAYLINTSKLEERKAMWEKKTRFIARYPIEPAFECFTATPYNVCTSGYPTWRAVPRRFMVAPYHGFGWKPEWGGIYKQVPQDYGYEYFAPVMATEELNVVEVSFPAEALRFTGVYKLVVVAKIYAPGFNFNNLKTITIDMPDVFELVKTTDEGSDTDIHMNVSHVEDVLTNISSPVGVSYGDIYVDAGSYGDNQITLTRTDGNPVDVDTSPFTAWYDGD